MSGGDDEDDVDDDYDVASGGWVGVGWDDVASGGGVWVGGGGATSVFVLLDISSVLHDGPSCPP